MINFTKMEYVLAVWFAGGPEGDWLAAVYRNKGEQQWRLTHRFRYYEGEQVGDPFKDADRKSWYEATAPAEQPEAKLMNTLGIVAEASALRFNGHADCVEVHGTPELFFEKARDRPWLHMRTEQGQVLSTAEPTSPKA